MRTTAGLAESMPACASSDDDVVGVPDEEDWSDPPIGTRHPLSRSAVDARPVAQATVLRVCGILVIRHMYADIAHPGRDESPSTRFISY